MHDPAEQVCEAISILTFAGIMDYNGHASVRSGEDFLINTGASDRADMTRGQICLVNTQGRVVQGDRPPNEVHLHAAIYAARPDICAIVHGHPKWTTLFTLTGTKIPVVMPQGCLVADLAVYPESHSISTVHRGRAVAELLGQGKGALLAGHGSVLCGETLAEAVALAIYAEQNAERAFQARLLGSAKAIPEAEYDNYRQVLAKAGLYEKCWKYFLSQWRSTHVRRD